MRTTLKRGMGRGAVGNGNGRPVLPPGTLSPITIYRQPEPPRRSRWARVRTVVLAVFVGLVMCASALGGGLYLWVHEDVIGAVSAKSKDVKVAAKRLDVALPGQPATALVVGYDERKGADAGTPPRSDTVMLVRADTDTNSISLLSFPRDLVVDVTCPGKPVYRGRINEAYTNCGTRGTL
jgi:anionic cell wall polymer biosynthesis LytR-Cps2A-Psr (LCP) family protein